MGQDQQLDQGDACKVKRPTITAAGFLWILSMAALGSWVAVMAADRSIPTEYLGPNVIVPDPVEDGGRVTLTMPVKRNRQCPGTVKRLLRNTDTKQIIAFYDPIPAIFPMHIGVIDQLPKTFELPPGLPAKVTYEADVCFTCNALQHWFPVCTKVPPVTFRVIQPRN